MIFKKLTIAAVLTGLFISHAALAADSDEAKKEKETHKQLQKEAKRLKKEQKKALKNQPVTEEYQKPKEISIEKNAPKTLFDIYDTLNVNDKSFKEWFDNEALKTQNYVYAMDLLDYNNYLSIENPIIKTRAMGTYADLIIIAGPLEQVNGYYNILKALNKRNAKFVLKINDKLPYPQATFLRVPKRSDPNSHTLDKGASIDESKLFEQQKKMYFNYANDVICRPNDEVCSPLKDEMVAVPSDSVTQKPNIIAPYSLYRLKDPSANNGTNETNETLESENEKEKMIEELIQKSQVAPNEEEREKQLLKEKENQAKRIKELEEQLKKKNNKETANHKNKKHHKNTDKKQQDKATMFNTAPMTPVPYLPNREESSDNLLVDKETTIKRSYDGTIISENSYNKKSPFNPDDIKNLEKEIKNYYLKSNGSCYVEGINIYAKFKKETYKDGVLCGYESVQALLLPLKDKLAPKNSYNKKALSDALIKDLK